MLRFRSILLLTMVCFCVVGVDSQTANAWPIRTIDRPLVLRPGMIEITGDTLAINMSEGRSGKPISLAPDIFWGYNSRWTFGITHNTGLCLTDDCPTKYNDMGFAGKYKFIAGRVAIAGLVGIEFPGFDPAGLGLRLGFLTRIRGLRFGVDFNPQLYVGVAKETLYPSSIALPFKVSYQFDRQLAGFVTFAWEGPLDGFSNAVRIPAGVGVTYALSSLTDIGTEVRFTNMFGQNASVDGRYWFLRFAKRL